MYLKVARSLESLRLPIISRYDVVFALPGLEEPDQDRVFPCTRMHFRRWNEPRETGNTPKPNARMCFLGWIRECSMAKTHDLAPRRCNGMLHVGIHRLDHQSHQWIVMYMVIAVQSVRRLLVCFFATAVNLTGFISSQRLLHHRLCPGTRRGPKAQLPNRSLLRRLGVVRLGFRVFGLVRFKFYSLWLYFETSDLRSAV